jgi:transposase-like protein
LGLRENKNGDVDWIVRDASKKCGKNIVDTPRIFRHSNSMAEFAHNALPKNLLGAMRYFADLDVCVDFVASMRWPNGVKCPHCDCDRVSFLKSRRIWKCLNPDCYKQFSVKTQSVFEDSPVPLDKWMAAVWMVVNCKNGISSYEIARDLKVTQKSAWFMLHRVRLALRQGHWEYKMGGSGSPVEADESWIGGAAKNKHKSKRGTPPSVPKYVKFEGNWIKNPAYIPRPETPTQTPVMGMLDREARKVRAHVIPRVNREELQGAILANVSKGSRILTDENTAYKSLNKLEFVHEAVNHIKEYVRGDVHTNGLENFWSLLKRGLRGTYVAVEPFHLDRYLDEQIFRYNNRTTQDNPLNDRDRFMLAVSQIWGKRLTYAELTGKVQETNQEPF